MSPALAGRFSTPAPRGKPHIVLFADETAFLGHKLLKLTSSEEAHLKGISFSIENSLSIFGWLFILLYSRP